MQTGISCDVKPLLNDIIRLRYNSMFEELNLCTHAH